VEELFWEEALDLPSGRILTEYEYNTKHINIEWEEPTIVKMFNLLVHHVTSRL
jgi:hypothetical protein